MKCSLYRNVFDREGVTVNLWDVLQGIKHGRWAEKLMYFQEGEMEKKYLPGAVFTGTFLRREDSKIVDYTGVMVMDIDTGTSLDITKLALKKDRSCMAVFNSPSGGLKALMFTRANKQEHRGYYEAVMERFEKSYRVKVDEKNKNVSRLCFVSYDPEMHINYRPVPMSVVPKRPGTFKPKKMRIDGADTFNACKRMTEKRCPHVEGNRNNHIHLLACNLNRMGVSYEEALGSIEQTSDLSFKEIKATVSGVYNRNSYEHGIWNE